MMPQHRQGLGPERGNLVKARFQAERAAVVEQRQAGASLGEKGVAARNIR